MSEFNVVELLKREKHRLRNLIIHLFAASIKRENNQIILKFLKNKKNNK